MKYYSLTLCLMAFSIADANNLGAMDMFQEGRLLKMRSMMSGNLPRLAPSLEERQSCPATCHGFCAELTDVCCSNGATCPSGYACCGTDNCSPVDATCCPTGYYAKPGYHCCPDYGSCPDGTTCDGAFCDQGSESGATGATSGSAPAPITTSPEPSAPTTDIITEPPTTEASTTAYWIWYSTTITWYYYSWYYTWNVIIQESTLASSKIFETTILSVSTSDSAAASAYFASVSAETTFPTPTDATVIPTLPSSATALAPSSTAAASRTKTPTVIVTTAPTTVPAGTNDAAGRLGGLSSLGTGVAMLVAMMLAGGFVVWL